MSFSAAGSTGGQAQGRDMAGNGKTAGRVQGRRPAAAAGAPSFEGGQMPSPWSPKGFNNILQTLETVNVSQLERFEDGAVVGVQELLMLGALQVCLQRENWAAADLPEVDCRLLPSKLRNKIERQAERRIGVKCSSYS